MKVEINNKEQNTEIKFPCLMETKSGAVIFMTCENSGTVIGGDSYSIGFYCQNWFIEAMTPFNGSITLSNE